MPRWKAILKKLLFPGGEDQQFRLVMTACTAVSVCLLVLGMAVFMAAFGNRKKGRALHGAYPGGGG